MEPQRKPPPHPTPNPPPLDLLPPQYRPSAAICPIPSSTVAPPSIPTTTNPYQKPNPNPSPNTNKPLTPSQQPPQFQPSYPPNQSKPTQIPQFRLGRPKWPQHQPSHLSQFTPASSSTATASVPATLPSHDASTATYTPSVASHKYWMAIGVPAALQSALYSPSFGQHQFGGLGRGAFSTPQSSSGISARQVRRQVPGYQTTVSSGLWSATQKRPGGIYVQQLKRPAPIRSVTNPNNQPTNLQNLSGHGLLIGSSVGSPGLNSLNAWQSSQLRGQPQPWLVPSQGKPPLPSHTYSGHMDPLPMQPKSHVPQQQASASPGPSQNLQVSSSQQQPQSFSSHQQDQFRQGQAQSVCPRSSIGPQSQTPRGLGHQRPSSFGTAQPFQPGARNSNAAVDAYESCDTNLSKRSIHELVNQVDSSEKLDPEVVDILVDIADDFVDSVNNYVWLLIGQASKVQHIGGQGYSASFRKKLEPNHPWLFGGDEIMSYRKPVINDIHREYLASVKKAIGVEAASTRNLPPGGTAVDSQR